MAEKKKYNSILISGRKDETLTYSKFVKDEESGESVKESLDKKVNVTDELTTQQIKDGAITNEKMAADSVGNTNLQDGSVSNEKLEDGSITNDKLAENSITKDKLKDNTIGVEKLDPELRQTINAATGLPEDLVKTIQNVDDTLKDHQSQLDDKQSQIDDNQQQITANDEDISLLQTRSTQMEETINSIAATGGASVASAVTYDNTTSQLTSVNVQGAVDELQGSKIDKTSILQESGNADDKVMSQKAVSDKLSDLGSKASYLKTRMLGIDYEYNKTISTEGTYTEKFTLSKGTYIIEGLPGTYSSKLSFHKNDSTIAVMSGYLNPGVKELLVLNDDVNYIRYYILSDKLLHFRIKKNSTPIDEELKSLKEETNEISLSQYSCGTLLDSEIIHGQTYHFNADTNSYSLVTHEYWHMSKTDVSTEKAVFIKLTLSNNSNVNSQALFLDKDNNVVLSLFDRIGKTAQEIVTDVIYVPKNAVKLLLTSEERNWIRVFRVTSKEKYNLPYYYFDDNYLSKVIDRIENNKNESDDTVTFAFITDVHLYANAKNSPKLINYIAGHTDLAFAVFGGDVPETDRNSIKELIDTGKEWNDLCKNDCPNVRIYPCRGNHDYLATINGKTEHASVAQTYNTVMANNIDNFIKGDPSKMYYYFDIPKRKLRVIVLDWYDKGYDYMYMSKEEWDWLAKVLITDNRILIFAHEGSAEKLYVEGENTYFHKTLHSILKACKNKRSVTYEYWIGSVSYQQTYDFSKAGDLIACISGHRHKDLYNVDDNLLSICTMCDAMYGSGRVKGTITEQAFDVFTVNFKNMTIKTVRVGYGSDRSFSF